MRNNPHKLPCGCCTGGCVCEVHSWTGPIQCVYHFHEEELRDEMRAEFKRQCEEELGGENGNAEEYL